MWAQGWLAEKLKHLRLSLFMFPWMVGHSLRTMFDITDFNCLECQRLNEFGGFFSLTATGQDCLAKVIGKKVKVAGCLTN